MLKKKTVLLLKMTEKDSRHVFKKRSCNNIFIMKTVKKHQLNQIH